MIVIIIAPFFSHEKQPPPKSEHTVRIPPITSPHNLKPLKYGLLLHSNKSKSSEKEFRNYVRNAFESSVDEAVPQIDRKRHIRCYDS